MKKLGYNLLAVAILISGLTGAFAQDAAPTPTPTETPALAASPAPQKFYLEVDAADLDAISRALAELPKRIADPLILKLNGQLRVQSQIIENKEAAEKPKKGKK